VGGTIGGMEGGGKIEQELARDINQSKQRPRGFVGVLCGPRVMWGKGIRYNQ